MQLALIFSGIEAALRRGNQTVRAYAPFFKAADPDAMSGASWPSVGAEQGPMILNAIFLNTKIVHNDFEIGKRDHERPRKFCDSGSPRGWSTVINGERAIW